MYSNIIKSHLKQHNHHLMRKWPPKVWNTDIWSALHSQCIRLWLLKIEHQIWWGSCPRAHPASVAEWSSTNGEMACTAASLVCLTFYSSASHSWALLGLLKNEVTWTSGILHLVYDIFSLMTTTCTGELECVIWYVRCIWCQVGTLSY